MMMSVFPSESHQRWIWIGVLGLVIYFVVMAALSLRDGDLFLGVLFLVLALVLITAELARIRSRRRSGSDS